MSTTFTTIRGQKRSCTLRWRPHMCVSPCFSWTHILGCQWPPRTQKWTSEVLNKITQLPPWAKQEVPMPTVAKHNRVFSKDKLTQESHKGTWFLFSEKGRLLKATASPCSSKIGEEHGKVNDLESSWYSSTFPHHTLHFGWHPNPCLATPCRCPNKGGH